MKPPNYREGTAETFCGNCGAFNRMSDTQRSRDGNAGFCRMFVRRVGTNMVCDKWYPRKLKVRREG